ERHPIADTIGIAFINDDIRRRVVGKRAFHPRVNGEVLITAWINVRIVGHVDILSAVEAKAVEHKTGNDVWNVDWVPIIAAGRIVDGLTAADLIERQPQG